MNLSNRLAFCAVATLGWIALLLLPSVSIAQDTESASDEREQIFSGPQIGEPVPGYEMNQVLGDKPGEAIDVVKTAGDKPLVLIFFHEKTRPAFGLMRALAKFGETKKEAGLTTAVCFLTKDPTETTQWVNQVNRNLPKNVVYGVYEDGIEGPGAYGLNRNVALTILVADKGKVVHNSALVQPSLETDGAKILQSIVEVTGGGDVPDIKTLAGQREMARSNPNANPNAEPNMRPWLAPVIKKGATNDEVDKAAKALEEHCQSDAAARKAIGRIANTVVNSGKLENYGTLRAQDYLKKWAKDFGDPRTGSSANPNGKKRSDGKKSEDSGDKK
jgi:ribosomal protein L10